VEPEKNQCLLYNEEHLGINIIIIGIDVILLDLLVTAKVYLQKNNKNSRKNIPPAKKLEPFGIPFVNNKPKRETSRFSQQSSKSLGLQVY